MGSFKQYLIMIVWIVHTTEGGHMNNALGCVSILQDAFNNSETFVEAYKYAYYNIIVREFRQQHVRAMNYLEYIYKQIDRNAVPPAVSYCNKAGEKLLFDELETLGYEDYEREALEKFVETSNIKCHEELNKHGFKQENSIRSFDYAFKQMKSEKIPAEDTHAVKYFDDIFANTSFLGTPKSPHEWCVDRFIFGFD